MNPETGQVFGQAKTRHEDIIPKRLLYRKVVIGHNKCMRERPQTELFCEWLENYLDFEHIKKKDDFSLEPMRFLAERFKHPERSFKSIHVAGSKGKGSVSTMMASIMEAAEIHAGLYTSPHLLDFKERVSSSNGTFSASTFGSCPLIASTRNKAK